MDVNGKPFLWYVIDHLRKAGFDEFGIVTGYKGEQVKQFCATNNIQATFIEQPEQLGTGHAVLLAKDFVGSDQFVVVAGDNLWSVDDLKKLNVDDEFTYVSGYTVEDPSRFGVLQVEGEKLVKIVEKPKQFVGKLVNASAYKFTPSIFAALEKIQPSERGELEVTDALNILAADGLVTVNILQDYWFDLATKEDIVEIGTFLQEHI